MEAKGRGRKFLSAVRRRGQTTVEYLLVMAALTVAFFMVYRVLQYSLTRQFKTGGVIILRMYSQPYVP